MNNYKENEVVTISIDRFNELVDIKQNFDEKLKEERHYNNEKLVAKETEFLKLLEHDYLACVDEIYFEGLGRAVGWTCSTIRGKTYMKITVKDVIAPYLKKLMI